MELSWPVSDDKGKRQNLNYYPISA